MADIYQNYQFLAAQEREGRDYTIRVQQRAADILVLAPHAGEIEPGTSELARAVAFSDLSLYLFEGIKPRDNGALHITSTNFDEPRALAAVAACRKAISFHGAECAEAIIYVGGRDEELRPHIEKRLEEAGFVTKKHENPGLQGTSPRNICNRCSSGAGLQLEISRGLRRQFFHSLYPSGRAHPTGDFLRFVEAVRKGIRQSGTI